MCAAFFMYVDQVCGECVSCYGYGDELAYGYLE